MSSRRVAVLTLLGVLVLLLAVLDTTILLLVLTHIN